MLVCPACATPAFEDARYCASCGTSLADRMSAGEERKRATIVFADITGSTALGDATDPEPLRLLLGRYFTAMATVIAAWGGTVEKYIGDAILAVFGVPVAREDDAIRALHAAAEMLTALEGVNAEIGERHGVTMSVRIGVNTGEIIAPLDARPAGQLLVTGDAVNVAARLQAAAEPGSILVGERTVMATRDAFAFGQALRLDVKGKAEPVLARPFLGAREPHDRAHAPVQSAMVARQRELDALLELRRETIASGQPHLAIVFGTAGIGKSRLLRELIDASSAESVGLNILRGRCPSAGHAVTFWALAEILREACAISLDESAEAAWRRLESCVAETLADRDASTDEVGRAIHALALTAGIAPAGGPLATLEPSEVAEEMARAWPLYLTAHAARSPTMVLIEDLHWADPQLLALLDRIVSRADGPLLIVGTARPELLEAHPEVVVARDSMTTITLRPLSAEHSEEVLHGLVEGGELPAELRATLVSRADGNPFFLEELVRRLIDEGALVRDGGRWRPTEAAHAVDVPDTVHAVLAARIDALPWDEKRTLQEASVVGRVFWEAPLRGPLADVAVHDALLGLERRGLVLARPTSTLAGQTEYLFKHALVRDVAYSTVPKVRRARAHADLGDWLEGLGVGRSDELGELIADHYRNAITGDGADLAWASDADGRETIRRRAFEALLRAAATARRRYSPRAVDLDTAALAMAVTDAERGQANEALGDDHSAFFHGDAALAAYEAALALLPSGVDARPAIARIVGKVGQAAERFGTFRYGPPAEVLERIAELGLEAAADEDRTRVGVLVFYANLSRAWVGSRMGRLLDQVRADPVPRAKRQAAAEEALELAERLDLPDDASMAMDSIAELALLHEDLPRYHEIVRRQWALVDRVAKPSERADILFEFTRERVEVGAYDEAVSLARGALRDAAELSPHEWMHASYLLMVAAFPRGLWDELVDLLDPHLAAARGELHVTCTAVAGAPLIPARILVERGERSRALALVPIPNAVPERIALPHAAHLLQYAVAVGANELATELVDRIVRMPRQLRSEALPALLETLPALGGWDRLRAVVQDAQRGRAAMAILGPQTDRAAGLLAAYDGLATAVPLFRAALSEFEALGVPFEVARTQEILAGQGPDDVDALLAAAQATYRSLGIDRDLALSRVAGM